MIFGLYTDQNVWKYTVVEKQEQKSLPLPEAGISDVEISDIENTEVEIFDAEINGRRSGSGGILYGVFFRTVSDLCGAG